MSRGPPKPVLAVSWLSKLKVAQLHRIAVATGIQTSGTKGVLAQRLSDELQSSNDELENVTKAGTRGRKGGGADDGKGMSILSIDMGIRNLAYAHIIVPPRYRATSKGKLDAGKYGESRGYLPILNAWTRLAVSSLPTSDGTEPAHSDQLTPSPRKDTKHQPTLGDDQVSALASGQNVEVKESFSPDIYASHAYSLITSLLATYKPTHVLIERQRFRSGGSSAVLEWTIRVGVFEGMLYAVLNTLRREGRIKGLVGADADVDVIVQGVDPRRVAMYWTESILKPSSAEKEKKAEEKEEEEVEEGKEKPKKTSRSKEGKKAKINLVANWWQSFLRHKDTQAEDSEPLKISLEEDNQVKVVVDAYLRKWAGGTSSPGGLKGRSGKKKDDSAIQKDEHPVAKIKKLDDLADCLLQGIAWLEWRDMRRKLARGGPEAVSWLEANERVKVERGDKEAKTTRKNVSSEKKRKKTKVETESLRKVK